MRENLWVEMGYMSIRTTLWSRVFPALILTYSNRSQILEQKRDRSSNERDLQNT